MESEGPDCNSSRIYHDAGGGCSWEVNLGGEASQRSAVVPMSGLDQIISELSVLFAKGV